jgi:L-malate glycosyltransferase
MKKYSVAIFEAYIFDKSYGNQKYIDTIYKFIDYSKYKCFFITPKITKFHSTISSYGVINKCIKPSNSLNQYGGVLLKSSLIRLIRVIFQLISYNYKVGKYLSFNNIEILQCHSIRSIIMSAAGGRLYGAKVLWYVKGHLDNPILDFIGFLLSNKVLFQNVENRDRSSKYIIRLFRKKIYILGNGIDLSEIDLINDFSSSEIHASLKGLHEFKLSSTTVNFVFVGQLSPLKGVEYLLKSFQKVNKDRCNKLFVIGDECTDEFRDFSKIIKERYSDDSIVFLGWRSDVLRILSVMDVFVLPSLSEGVPKSIIEAMALGKPVISTYVGGIPGLVDNNKTGILVQPKDVGALMDAMQKLAESKELRKKMGERARMVAYQKYSIKENIQQLQNIYKGLIDES